MISNKEKTFVSAVVYVHNNEDNIKKFLMKIYNLMSDNFEKFELICINDASSDDSTQKIKEFSSGVHGAVISILNMSFFQGVELSMNAGVDITIGDFVFEFDSIFIDYDINTIMQVYNHALKGFDIVSSSPRSKIKKTSKMFYAIFNKYSSNQYSLKTETFRILSRRAINRVHSMCKTIPYRKAIYANCGLKSDIITYENIKNPELIKSKPTNEERMSVATNSLILFTNIAYKYTIAMTFVMMFITIFMGAYTIFVFLRHEKPVQGWTTTMLFLSIAFFGLFAIQAIIIKYLSILIDLVFSKQKYTVESVEKV